MAYYPQWGAFYPPDLILHREQIEIPVNYITQLIMLQFCHWINMSMSSYNKLIGQQVVCHNTKFYVVTLPVTMCRTVDVMLYNTV